MFVLDVAKYTFIWQSCWVNAVLVGNHLPELCADLIASARDQFIQSNPNHLHNMMQLRVKIPRKFQLLFCWKVAALTALNVHELTHGFWQQEAFQASEVPFCLRAAAMDIFLLKSVQTKVQQLNAARFLRHQRKQIPRLKRF